nr:integrase, catalytic region, zinc finger, CCHC-type, peptidase aspartic, catalytic [Tanacetum cinerariifolium]
NDREDIGKLGAKGDIGFFIGYSADSCAYRIYNRRTKKIMETMNVSFDELSAMDFEQRKFKNQVLKVYFDFVGITHQMSSVRTPQQNGVVERRNRTIYNRRTKKIMETMNVSFDELSAMAFEQRSSKPRLQCMTSGHISSGLGLTYAPSAITKQQPTEGELDLLFEAMYDDYFGGQPS